MAIVKRGDRGLKPGVIYALSGILFMVLEFNEKKICLPIHKYAR